MNQITTMHNFNFEPDKIGVKLNNFNSKLLQTNFEHTNVDYSLTFSVILLGTTTNTNHRLFLAFRESSEAHLIPSTLSLVVLPLDMDAA